MATTTPTTLQNVPAYGSTFYDPKTGQAAGVNKFDPNTGLSTAPVNQSTTTLSNTSKINQVGTNVAKLDSLSQKGVTTDANGAARYSDGSFVPEQQTNADTSSEDSSINSLLDQMRASNDSAAGAQISSIQQQYAVRKQQQDQSNMQQEKKVQNALLMGGATGQGSSAQYAPVSSEGIVSSQEAYGIQQLASLDAQEQAAIASARASQQAQNYQVMEKQIAQVEKIRAEKVAKAQKLNDDIAERNKKAQEEYLQSEKDSAVADIYSGGITDVPTILKKLKEQGIQATASDIATTLKNTGIEDINKIASDAASFGAPLSVLAKIGQAKSPTEALMAAEGYTRDPLEAAYKKAQIAKIYQDINDVKSSGGLGNLDTANAVAYAQQYASTGQIPTGLPKGTFGIISQVAKELPKAPGTLVDINTGIKPSKLTSTQEDGIVALKDLKTKLADLDNMNTVGGRGTVVAYNGLRNEIIDLLARARTGAAISSSEEALYKKKVPSIIGFSKDAKIKSLSDSLGGKLDTILSTNGVSIYGYSKVNIPGLGEKTVGDTIESNGHLGRVNPDGSITILNQ